MDQAEHPFPEIKPVTTAFIMISVNPELEKEIAEKLIAKVIYADLAASHPIKAFFPAEPQRY